MKSTVQVLCLFFSTVSFMFFAPPKEEKQPSSPMEAILKKHTHRKWEYLAGSVVFMGLCLVVQLMWR